MIELTPEKFFHIIHLIDKNVPNLPIIMSVVEKHNPGKVWVDESDDPSVCLVIASGGYSFIGRKDKLIRFDIMKLVKILIANQPIKLIFRHNDPLSCQLKNSGFKSVERIQFCNPSIMNGDLGIINDICKRLPNGFEIKKIDAALLKQSNWLSYIKLFYGSEESFVINGFGLALINDNELVSEAFACFIGGGFVETGSVTSEKHRRRGYSTIIRAFLIKEVFSKNLQPISSCNLDNIASAKVSAKLGFEDSMRYHFLVI